MTTVIVTPERWLDETLDLSADSFHHLFRVRRLRRGDFLRVVDGHGRARQGQVAAVERHSARLSLGESVPTNEAEISVELLVAAPRPQRAAWLVEKATEVGVVAVRFLHSMRSPRSYGTATVKRLVRTARAAVEQSDRSLVPEVTAGHEWQDLPSLLAPHGCSLVLQPDGPTMAIEVPSSCRSVGLLVGPEGGWDESELTVFESLACRPVSLGPRILRVETAAVVGASLLLVTPSVDTI
jgi:16S rRNA (uracil1498-N3)-methyltransferase